MSVLEYAEYVKFKEAIRPDFDPRKYEPAANDLITTVVWGKPGASPFQQSQFTSLKLDDDQERSETKRTFDVVRIKDPDNKDNHIDVEVMTAYQSRNKISKERVTINFDRTKESDTVEILKSNQQRTSKE